MLEQLSRHSLIDMEIDCKGDLHIDDHHSVEDTGIAIGQAISKALGDRRGITRYASLDLAMDETMTKAAVDLPVVPSWSGTSPSAPRRSALFDTDWCGSSFRRSPRSRHHALHVMNHYGANNHHIAENLASRPWRVCDEPATEIDPRQAGRVPFYQRNAGLTPVRS